MKRLAIFLLIALPLVVAGQEDYVMLKGRVTSGGRGVPYATLQLMGTSTGVSCNDAGEYELKVLWFNDCLCDTEYELVEEYEQLWQGL